MVNWLKIYSPDMICYCLGADMILTGGSEEKLDLAEAQCKGQGKEGTRVNV